MAIFIETIWDQGELTLDRQTEPGWGESFSSLDDNAKSAAPLFCDALLASLRRSKLKLNLPEGDLEPLRSELQRWFVGLFKPREADIQDLNQRQAYPQRNRFQLPLSFLLCNLEIILRFGREVAALSPHSEQSLQRFMRSLSDELAQKQVGVEQGLDEVTGLLLLD